MEVRLPLIESSEVSQTQHFEQERSRLEVEVRLPLMESSEIEGQAQDCEHGDRGR